MKRGPELWLSPLVALAVLAASATQIVSALGVKPSLPSQRAGAWICPGIEPPHP